MIFEQPLKSQILNRIALIRASQASQLTTNAKESSSLKGEGPQGGSAEALPRKTLHLEEQEDWRQAL